MPHRRAALLVLCGGFLCGPLLAQSPAPVRIQARQVAGSVYMLEGQGGNIGASVGKDGILIVDDQFAEHADEIRAALADLATDTDKLAFVVNTHWHGDHTGGNVVFGRTTPILAQSNVRRRLASQQSVRGRLVDPLPPEGLPGITFDQSLSVHCNGEEIRAVHFPHAHTDGDAAIFFEGSNVVHLGDLFFAGRFPFVDLESGGDVEGLIEAVARLVESIRPDAKIIPGHGPLSSVADLKLYLTMLRETTGIVGRAMRAGKSLQEIQEQGLGESFASWDWQFVPTARWIEIVYHSFSGRGGLKRKAS